MKNKTGHFIIITLMLLMIFSTQNIKSQNTTLMNSKTVLTAKWGSEEGEIGLLDRPEVERCGPLSFSITEKGEILLLDTVNKRAIKFDSTGKPILTVKNVVGWSICSDGGGGFFVFGGEKLNHYSGEGMEKEAFLAPLKKKVIEGYGSEMVLTPENKVEVNEVTQKSIPIAVGNAYMRSVRFDAIRGDELKIREGKIGNGTEPLRFTIKRISSKDIRILGEDYDGKDLVSVPIKLDSGYAGAVLFKGQDLNGNLYVELEKIVDKHTELEVHCYSKDGKRLKVFNLPNNYFTTVYKKTEVTPEGIIYQLLTTHEGIQVIRY